MTKTLFHKIRKGEVPAHTVFENDSVLAFLDINPATKGHTLIIPKEHYRGLMDCPLSVYSELTATAKELAARYQDILGCDGFNIVQSTGEAAEQEIQYIHLHLIPRYDDGDFRLWHHRPDDSDLGVLADELQLS